MIFIKLLACICIIWEVCKVTRLSKFMNIMRFIHRAKTLSTSEMKATLKQLQSIKLYKVSQYVGILYAVFTILLCFTKYWPIAVGLILTSVIQDKVFKYNNTEAMVIDTIASIVLLCLVVIF